MRAMVLSNANGPLQEQDIPPPISAMGQVLVRVEACGVCRTDLHVVDGDLNLPKPPLVLGHEIVGHVTALGPGSTRFRLGDRLGIPWLGWTCGACRYCRSDRENLCEQARFTGHTINGGYAEYTIADERFCFSIPSAYSDVQAAPLLCAGLIGHRCLLKAGSANILGIYGLGGAADIVAQIAIHEGRNVFAFTRSGDATAQRFARALGMVWAGGAGVRPPQPLDAAIIFAPDASLVPQALKATGCGRRVVCGGIHMSDVPAFPYDILWRERTICSVANPPRRRKFFPARTHRSHSDGNHDLSAKRGKFCLGSAPRWGFSGFSGLGNVIDTIVNKARN